MRRSAHQWPSAAVALAFLAACSGGGGGSPAVVPAPAASSAAPALPGAAPASVTFTVRIPGRAATSAIRRAPAFVSSATKGLQVQVYADPQSANPAPIATFAFDLSSASNGCTPASGTGRTCTFTFALAGGTDDFVDTLYDAAPSGGSFGTANVLGVGRTTQTIALHQANAVAISIGGRVASLTLGPDHHVAVDTARATYALAVTAFDAGGVPIVAGASDPYDNAIGITASDGGNGHTLLSLNGGAPATTVSSTQSSDVVTVAYDGAGTAGYSASIGAVASGGQTGASVTFDTLDVTLRLVSFLGSGETQTETIVEPHDTAPFTVTPAANCATVTTASALSGTGATETFVLASGTLAGTCYVTVSSETGQASVPVKVVNLVPGIVTVPQHRLFTTVPSGANPAIQAYDVANGGKLVQTITGSATTLMTPNGVARDSAGSIYVSDLGTGQIDVFASNASGNVAPSFTLTVPGAGGGTTGSPSGVGVDRAGDVFAVVLFTLFTSPLDVFAAGSTTSAAGATNPLCLTSLAFDYGVAVDASGEAFVDQTCQTAVITVAPFGAAQVKKSIVLPFASAAGSGVAIDLADDVYVTDPGANTFLEYAPTASGGATPIRTGTGLATPSAIAVASDGTVYVVTHPSSGGTTSTAIAVFPPGATAPASTFPISTSNVAPGLSL